MPRELTIRLTISKEVLQWGMIAVLLAVLPSSVGSEVVTLNTYYPAPYGIYTQMRTTGQTTLAESGGDVGIGTTAPAYELDVVGNAAFESSNQASSPEQVGIGFTPGQIMTSEGSTSEMTWLHSMELEVDGRIGANNYLYAGIGNNTSACTAMTSTGGNPYVSPPITASETPCSGGQYATYVPGIATEGNWNAPMTGQSTDYFPSGTRLGIPVYAYGTDTTGAGTWIIQQNSNTGNQEVFDLMDIFQFQTDDWYCCPY